MLVVAIARPDYIPNYYATTVSVYHVKYKNLGVALHVASVVSTSFQ